LPDEFRAVKFLTWNPRIKPPPSPEVNPTLAKVAKSRQKQQLLAGLSLGLKTCSAARKTSRDGKKFLPNKAIPAQLISASPEKVNGTREPPPLGGA